MKFTEKFYVGHASKESTPDKFNPSSGPTDWEKRRIAEGQRKKHRPKSYAKR